MHSVHSEISSSAQAQPIKAKMKHIMQSFFTQSPSAPVASEALSTPSSAISKQHKMRSVYSPASSTQEHAAAEQQHHQQQDIDTLSHDDGGSTSSSSPSATDDSKKLRRKERNRQAAAASRERKKQYVQKLEAELAAEKDHSQELEGQTTVLRAYIAMMHAWLQKQNISTQDLHDQMQLFSMGMSIASQQSVMQLLQQAVAQPPPQLPPSSSSSSSPGAPSVPQSSLL